MQSVHSLIAQPINPLQVDPNSDTLNLNRSSQNGIICVDGNCYSLCWRHNAVNVEHYQKWAKESDRTVMEDAHCATKPFFLTNQQRSHEKTKEEKKVAQFHNAAYLLGLDGICNQQPNYSKFKDFIQNEGIENTIGTVEDPDGKTFLMKLCDIKNWKGHLAYRHFRNDTIEDQIQTLNLFLSDYKEQINPNAQDRSGKTALHYAMQSDNKDIIKLLFSHFGKMIDFTIKDNSQKRPIDCIKETVVGTIIQSKEAKIKKMNKLIDSLKFSLMKKVQGTRRD